jgi:putative inorganic carbon (hco3(-)) transporter
VEAMTVSGSKAVAAQSRATSLAYGGVLVFVLLYFTRPSDWIPGMAHVPLAKIAGFFALSAFFLSLGRVRQSPPREVIYLILLLVQLCLTVPFASVWRGGAFMHVLDFAKIVLIVLVMSMTVITRLRLKRIIFLHTICLVIISAVTIVHVQDTSGRLEGAIGGDFSNPNDLGLAIAIILPFVLAFLLGTRGSLRKVAWTIALLLMVYASLRTASRSGFLALFAVLAVSLWELAIKGRRPYLLVLVAISGLGIWTLSSGQLVERFGAIFNPKDTHGAYGSAQQREQLLWRSLEVTAEHPFFGVGPGNFTTVSGVWRTTHNSYTLMSAEGGLPALILYLMILWRAMGNIRRARRLQSKDPRHLLLAGAMHASLIGYLVGSFFSSVAYSFFPYLLVAYTTALVRNTETAQKRFEEAEERTEALSAGEFNEAAESQAY